MSNLYIKDNQILSRQSIVLYDKKIIDGEEVSFQIINPTHEQILNSGWEVYVRPEPTIEDVRANKLRELTAYDSSSEVNTFYVNDLALWLSREERVVIKDRFQREYNDGKEITKLRYSGLSIELSPATGIQLIDMVSSYADKCFDATETHKENINALETIEEINNYDYTTGYPEKIQISI